VTDNAPGLFTSSPWREREREREREGERAREGEGEVGTLTWFM